MSTTALDLSGILATDPVLLKAISDSVASALTMCDTSARCVSVARVPTLEHGAITGMIGVHGQVSGFITVNMPERLARLAVGGLLQDRFDAVTNQVIDGVGEITNLIAGGIKKGLMASPWAFRDVTVPSVIIGKSYQIAYSRGLEYLAVTFEHETEEVLLIDDRLFQVAVSLIRL